MELKNIIVDGLLTRYGTQGNGKNLLLLHGWGDSLATFHELSEHLSKQFQVTVVDLPGFGQSQAPEEAWGIQDYAEFVKKFVAKADISPYAIVGHSNGGAVAIGLCQNGFNAEKLVLIASAGLRNPRSAKKQLLKVGAKTAKILTVGLSRATKTRLRNRLYGVIGSDYTAVPHMQETFKRVVAEDMSEAASLLHLSTLLIYGSDDKATPPAYGERYAKLINGSKLQILDGAGHFVHHDKTTRVAQLIEEFCA